MLRKTFFPLPADYMPPQDIGPMTREEAEAESNATLATAAKAEAEQCPDGIKCKKENLITIVLAGGAEVEVKRPIMGLA